MVQKFQIADNCTVSQRQNQKLQFLQSPLLQSQRCVFGTTVGYLGDYFNTLCHQIMLEHNFVSRVYDNQRLQPWMCYFRKQTLTSKMDKTVIMASPHTGILNSKLALLADLTASMSGGKLLCCQWKDNLFHF